MTFADRVEERRLKDAEAGITYTPPTPEQAAKFADLFTKETGQ